MDLVIYMEALNSIVIRDDDCDDNNVSELLCGSVAWVHDPLGFVHPAGPFFDWFFYFFSFF